MKTFCFSLFFIIASICNLSATDQAKPGLFDHWAETDQPTEVTIYLDMAALESKRMTPDLIEATLNDGDHDYALRVNVRGRFRRRTCAMPPLKLHFDKQWLKQAGFNKHNDFKLVTHCTRDAAGQESILREQLAYELYRVVAPNASYRTQLLKVNYVDTRDGSTESSYAILIEDTDELKDRMNAKTVKSSFGISSAKIKNEAQIAMFNYMIGNADYSFKMNRNLKFLKKEDDHKVTVVPYDFDFSGLVSAKYAGHSGHTDSPRELVWEYEKSSSLAPARGQFLYQKAAILETVDNFTELSAQSRHEIHDYLNGFFTEIESNRLAR